MPINTKGGKGCKKRKRITAGAGVTFIDRQEGQMMARALRALGNRNFLCYGNDDVLRLCHVCGKMKGRQYVNTGDIILITLRKFGNEDDKKVENGDIIGIYDPAQFSSLKKEEGVNLKLFMKLEELGTITQVGKDYSRDNMNLIQDVGYDFEESGEESGSGNLEGNNVVDKKDKVDHRATANTRAELENEIVNVDDL
jgi:initiation factor 1A